MKNPPAIALIVKLINKGTGNSKDLTIPDPRFPIPDSRWRSLSEGHIPTPPHQCTTYLPGISLRDRARSLLTVHRWFLHERP